MKKPPLKRTRAKTSSSPKQDSMINVIVTADAKFPVDKSLIESTVLEILQNHPVSGKVEIGVSIVGDRRMHQINKKYRGIDSTTNILTFALEDSLPNLAHLSGIGFVASPDNIVRLGDVLISYPQVVEDATVEGVSVDVELHNLIQHGVKHLLGLHHE
jgi:probable rRNA maturation factor